jgi:hypothetical protein
MGGDAPEEIMAYEPWGRFDIVVKQSRAYTQPRVNMRTGKTVKVSNHRIFFRCQCGKLIPVGRSHQHLPTCKADAANLAASRPYCTDTTAIEELPDGRAVKT